MEETQEWLNEDLLCSVLKASIKSDSLERQDGTNITKGDKKNFSVVNYKAKRAIADGKNFTSKVYKVNVTYKDNEEKVKTQNYIMKRIISMFTTVENTVSKREGLILKALTKIENFVNSTLGPKLYMVKDNIVVMEDLTEQGFQLTKLKLLDFSHSVLALESLAKFHAGSLALHQKYPKHVQEEIGSEVYRGNKGEGFDVLLLFETNIRNLGQQLSRWPESQQYAEYFPLIASKLRGYFENVQKRKSLLVLNHGDYSLNNMMFRYDEDKVCEHRIVDFQTTRFVPATCDFQYFIGSSTDFNVRHNRLEELITVYLDTFNSTLTDIGITQSITREQFEENLKEDRMMYIVGLSGVLFLVLSGIEQTITLEDFKDGLEKDTSDVSNDLPEMKDLRHFITPVLDDLFKNGVLHSFRD